MFLFNCVDLCNSIIKRLAKNLHEQKTNSMNKYCLQRGCATKIKGLHTFSVVLIHKMALKKQYDLNHINN